jgi:hypothetical protein
MSRIHLLTITAISLALAAPASAGGIDVTPEIAYMAPQSDQANIANGAASAALSSSMGFGGRLTFWANDTFAFEATGMFTSTELEGQVFGETGAIGASVFFGTGRAVLGFGSKTRFLLSGGLGVRTGSYDYVEGGTFMIGVVGAGASIPMGQNLGLRLGLDDYIYNAQWDLGNGILTDTILQHDLTLTVGLSFLTGRE